MDRAIRPRIAVTVAFAFVVFGTSLARAENDPLPSWNESESKRSIVDFVARVTDAKAGTFVPVADRIAVFDNDGTLWPENPIPFQFAFAVYEVKRLLPTNPQWKDDPAIKALLSGDAEALKDDQMKGLMRVLTLTHAGMTTDDFADRVEDWIAHDRHPRFGRPYVQCYYQPMIELLAYLQKNGFKTYIVSGGGMDFMRVWSERIYGIVPEQVIGSHGQVQFEMHDGRPRLVKSLESVFVDDKAGKPVAIDQFIGKRPIAAFGNSDGDHEMIQYVAIDNPHPSLGVLIHHTDAEREYAYDANPKSSGKLIAALDEAVQRGWTVVDMKDDWSRVLKVLPSSDQP